RLGDTYVVVEQSPALTGSGHDRRAPGLNHLAFHLQGHALVDDLAATAVEHGWTLLFPDRHPYAGGQEHYAAYLEDADGFEVELIATWGDAATTAKPIARQGPLRARRLSAPGRESSASLIESHPPAVNGSVELDSAGHCDHGQDLRT